VAHDEDLAGWTGVISQWMERNNPGEAVSLMQLQQGLKMPLVEVWMGLLLSQEHNELEPQGKFYDADGIYLESVK